MSDHTRADSHHEASSIMADAIKGKRPPDHLKLRERDIPFWNAIVAARTEWTDVDLAHAANLARCQADIEIEQEALDNEGSVVPNAKGNKMMNPRHTILEQLSRRAVALSAKIQVHAAATIGESKLSGGKNTAKREALAIMSDLEDDDLIARPN